MDVVRRIVVLLTVITVVFGPQCCCCTFRATAADPAATGGGCCCEQPAVPAGCPLERVGHDGERPCRCRESIQVGTPPVEQTWSGPDASAAACPGWLAACLASRVPGCEPSGASIGGGRWPPVGGVPTLSGRALLRALSTLRC